MASAAEILDSVGRAGGGLGAGVGNVICAIKGTCVPDQVTTVAAPAPAPRGGNNIVMLAGLGLVVIVMILLFKKK